MRSTHTLLILAVTAASAVLSTSVIAAPGTETAKLMATPASAFDMFMFRLYESAKCKIWISDPEAQPDLCMTALSYDADEHQLQMHFRAFPINEDLGDFIDVDDDQREIILTQQVERVAARAGAASTWGMLYSIPIRNGWSGSDLDEKAFRAELASRTVVHLHVTYGSSVYTATREMDGGIVVDVTKRRVSN